MENKKNKGWQWTPELRAAVKKLREAIFSPLQIQSMQTDYRQNFGKDGQPQKAISMVDCEPGVIYGSPLPDNPDN